MTTDTFEDFLNWKIACGQNSPAGLRRHYGKILYMKARCASGRILIDHAENEFAQFLVDASSSNCNQMPQNPRPIQFDPAWCRRTTVSTWTSASARIQFGQIQRSITQNNLSVGVCRVRGRFFARSDRNLSA